MCLVGTGLMLAAGSLLVSGAVQASCRPQYYSHMQLRGGGAQKTEEEALSPLRYTAYGSELAEAFRPMCSDLTVAALYSVTIAYIGSTILAVSRTSAATGTPFIALRATLHECIFQFVANLLFPTQIVHFIVHESECRLGYGWGPTLIGLSVVPFLPRLDPVLEAVVGKVFALVWPPERENRKSELS